MKRCFIIFTLDNEAETKTAKGQEGKDRLFLRLAFDVTFCGVIQLESQSKLSRLNILFDLKEKIMYECNSSDRV